MPNWKTIAAARGLDIPEADLERIAPVLETLEAAYRPLVRDLRLELEPAVVFSCPPEWDEA